MVEKTVFGLRAELDSFIRKYYKNQIIKGVIYTSAIFIGSWLLFLLMEHFGRFGTTVRALFFFSFVSVLLFSVSKFLIIPSLKLIRLGKVISDMQAATIIGQHFTEVRDKLINLLQLSEQASRSTHQNDLLLAGIRQKTNELKPINFTKAIDFSKNRPLAKYVIVPLIIFIAIYIYSPSLISGSTQRLISYNNTFEPEAPFKFEILNNELRVAAREDFELQVSVSGKEIPDMAYIQLGDNRFKLSKSGKGKFTYSLRNVQKDLSFRLYADGFYSKPYTLLALARPEVINFKTELKFPRYTGLQPQILKNIGDLNVPEGTEIVWRIDTEFTSEVQMLFNDSLVSSKNGEKLFQFDWKALRNGQYFWITANEQLKDIKSVAYQLSVIKDAYPGIEVQEFRDSVMINQVFFTGTCDDDYGLRSLKYHWKHLRNGQHLKSGAIDVPFQKNFTRSNFLFNFDFNSMLPEPGDEMEYYFEVGDNDEINGSKKTRSMSKIMRIPTKDELDALRDQSNENIKSELSESLKELKRLQKEIDDLNKKLLQQKNVGWQEKQQMEQLLKKQKDLLEKLEKTQQESKMNQKQQEQFNKPSEDILQKQKELEKLFDQLLNPELKEKMKELEKMLEQFDRNKMKDILEQMKMNNKDVEKELDRQLELFKQLEFEQKFEQLADKLQKLAEKQNRLAEETQKSDQKLLDIHKQQQEELNKEFLDLQNQLDDLEKKNQALENPMDLNSLKPMESEIKDEMDKGTKDLNQGKQSKASKSQKAASDKMKQMSDKMMQMQEQAAQEQAEEDLNKLRELLDNVIQLSFEEEKLLKRLGKTAPNDPQYTSIIQQQKRIKDDAAMIEDSLLALSKRIMQIQPIINKEIAAINMNLDRSLSHLSERQTGQALSRQQFIMTSFNNLALLLSDITQQMQEQMAQQMQNPSDGSCKKPGKNKKPGKGNPSLSTMRQLQEQINKQLEQLKKGMQPGQGQQGMGNKMMNESLARLAAQQEALRNELQKLMNDMMKEGLGGTGQLKEIINQMDKTETDLVNKNLTQETLRRQQDILTKLLESEKAERERDQDEQRESNENKIDFFRNNQKLFEYNRLMQQQTELLKTISPTMKPFYKSLVKEYFNNVTNP